MLYLEDYLEMIEQLPQELRDRFTDVRELDLQVQNAYDSLEERTKTYFANAKRMKMNERESEFQSIKREYLKVLEDADEKVEIAGQLYALVDRYLRRLDTELHKFKMELEADNAGITELLEKRSLELDSTPTPINNIPKEVPRRGSNTTVSGSTEKRNQVERKVMVSGGAESPGGYTLGQMGVGSNAIAVAASQAIAATQQMQQGRRTASMKASYEAVNTGGVHDFSIGRELAAHSSSEKKQKRKNTTPSPGPLEELVGDSLIDSGPLGSDTDWTYDPNEPRYCICNQVSYGDMVACDNGGCPVEWFHYPCVGLTSAPKGKWYCPQCTANSRRRGSRKDKA